VKEKLISEVKELYKGGCSNDKKSGNREFQINKTLETGLQENKSIYRGAKYGEV
jgi:hypothetical protein